MLTHKQHIENMANRIQGNLYECNKVITMDMAISTALDSLESLPIIFLEQDAMPEVGDVISGIVGGARILQEVMDGTVDCAVDMIARGCIILQRQGKQVITVKGESDGHK